MPERLDVLNMNVEKNAKADATDDCWQVLVHTSVAVNE